jgi:uncharacterized LabA/DUF88 family protein
MQSLLRIAVFYDGTYFHKAQNHFYKQKLGWLSFPRFHKFLEGYVKEKIQGDFEYKVIYSSWYQGLFPTSDNDKSNNNLKKDRDIHHDLMHAGIEAKFQPMSSESKEKGVDVAMAIDIFENCLASIFDVAILVTGDGDFVPLVRALKKYSVSIINAHFKYEEGNSNNNCYVSSRLQNACDYVININSLESNKEMFKKLFEPR